MVSPFFIYLEVLPVVQLGAGSTVRSRRRERGVKAAPVLRRADVERAQKAAPHRLRAREPAGERDSLDGLGGVLQPASRRLQPHAFDVARGGDTGLRAEGAREVAG